MLFHFELLGESEIGEEMHCILREKHKGLQFAPDWGQECKRVCKVCKWSFGNGIAQDWDGKCIVDKLIGVLEKTKDTTQILTELQLTELARSVDHECRMMEAQLKKDAEKDRTAASSPESMEMPKKCEMENGNAPDKKTSSKLIIDSVSGWASFQMQSLCTWTAFTAVRRWKE